MSSIKKWILIGIISLIVFVLILGIISYRDFTQVIEVSKPVNNMRVWFQNPQPGSKFEVSTWIPIEVQATGPHPIHTMELWANDQLVEIQAAPFEEGIRPFIATFLWNPNELGTHFLFARITYGDSLNATSSVLILNSVEFEDLTTEDIENSFQPYGQHLSEDIYVGDQKITADSPLALSLGDLKYPEPPPAVPPDMISKEVYDISRSWKPTLNQWFKFQFSDLAPPIAPNVSGNVEGCNLSLSIQDLSDNEQGFHVYRRSPGLASFMIIDTLAPSTGPGIKFQDPDMVKGSYSYYVSAFNQHGEAVSNIVTLMAPSDESNSEDCSSQQVYELEIDTLLSEIPLDQSYCYYSINQLGWNRHPADSGQFLSPTADGLRLEVGTNLPSFGGPTLPTSLDLECWSWSGGDLHKLGRWQWEQLSTEIQPGVAVWDMDEVGINLPPQVQLSPDKNAKKPGIELPINFQIPIPTIWIGHGPQDCADYSNIPNPIILGLICGDVADDIDFALWEVNEDYWENNYCPGEPCFTKDDIIGYNVYDSRTYKPWFSNPELTVDAPSTIHFIVDEKGCYSRDLWVTALVEYEGQILQSPPSSKVNYPGNPDCPYILGEGTKTFLFSWDTIDFSVGNIDDGVDAEDDAEGYGWLSVYQHKFNLGELGWSGPVTTVIEDLTTIDKLGYFEFEDDDDDNPYYWANIPLWQSWKVCQYINKCSPALGQNTMEIELSREGYFYIHSHLLDADPQEIYDDYICITNTTYIYAAWVEDAGGYLQGSISASHPDASCLITFSVTMLD